MAADPTGALAAAVKEMQRSDPIAREQWGAYCDTHGRGLRDPARHDATFIQNFVSHYNAGMRFEAASAAGAAAGVSAAAGVNAANLAELFKEGQRKSAPWKSAWAQYGQVYGGGVNDPAKHEAEFLVGFMDFLGQRGLLAMQMIAPNLAAPTPAAAAPPTGVKRPRTASATGGAPAAAPAASGDPLKDALVIRVKAYQRSGDDAKAAWATYCDAQLGGVRDPARHDSVTLSQFVVAYGI